MLASLFPIASALGDEARRFIVDVNGNHVAASDQYVLYDHEDQPIAAQPKMASFNQRCQQAIRRAVSAQGRSDQITLFPDQLHGVSVAPRAQPEDPRFVYFTMASREIAVETVPRLVRAFYHPSHLFLTHVDLKANASMHDALVRHAADYPNVHVLKTRRLVQWGAFSMISTMLDALASFVDRIEYDFFINLSDADLALRTNEEMVRFFGRFKERNFMLVSHADASPFRKYMHDVLGKYVAIECGGFGFATVNTTAMRITPARPCCFGRSGPVVYGQISYEPPRMAPSEQLFSGSQWVVLSAAFCSYLIKHPEAHRWTRIFERRLLPDEVYLATIAMHSSFRHGVVAHNLRYLDWPHAKYDDPNEYWAQLGWHTLGGPMLLNASTTSVVGPAITARKFDPGHDPVLTLKWDAWMARKLAGEAAPGQSAIAEGLVARDPQLLELRPSDAVLAHLHVPLETVPVSRTRRRRVSALHFDDGSSCSCAAGCAGDVCCKDLADGRGAMCHPPTGDPSWDEQEAALPGCPAPTEGLASASGGSPVRLIFSNRARYPVKLSFMDHAGGERAWKTLEVDQHAEFDALTTHAWRARNFNGVLLMELPSADGTKNRVPGDTPVTVEIPECRWGL